MGAWKGEGIRGLDAGAYSFVMATGIVSIAASLRGLPVVSDALFAVAAAAWLLLAGVAGMRTVRRRFSRPRLQSFAIVAGTAVLGARCLIAGEPTVALAAWSLSAAFWLALLLRRPELTVTTGGSLLLVVSTESLAVLACLLAERRIAGLLSTGLAFWIAGLAVYPLVAGSVGFALRRHRRFHPELWIVMGALAIATLAGSELLSAARALGDLSPFVPWMRGIDIATWALASALIVPMLAGELRSRHGWRYTTARWSFVFPLGMYAAASQTLGETAAIAAVDELGRAFVVVALAAWVFAFAGLARRAAGR